MKRPQQILAGLQIHAGLAADGRIDLRQQRGWNLNHRNSAHEDGGQERAHIPHHSAAKRHEHRVPIGTETHQLLRQLLKFGQRLRSLAIRHDDDFDFAAGFGETLAQRASPMLANRRRRQCENAGIRRNEITQRRS